MIVVDASAAIELLLRTDAGISIARRVSSQVLHAPHLLDIEVTQVLRRNGMAGPLEAQRAEEALQDFIALRIRRYPHTPLLGRVWQLRHNLSAYDALYVALAESLDATLLTCDGGVASAPGHRARIQLM